MLSAENISFKVGNRFLLSETSLSFEPGRFHVIMGANGAGKSTLLNLLAGNKNPTSGRVFLNGKEIRTFSKKALAQKRAVLSQQYHIAFPISVKDLVLMGRYPYYRNNPSLYDNTICNKALAWMQVDDLKNRDYNTLSGGEAQKVQMSRVLAQIWPDEQEQKILFLDEPVSHLDLKYQHQLLQVAHELCQNAITIIAVLHDINLALTFADRILFMKNGVVAYQIQNPFEITPAIIEDVFGIKSQVLQLPEKNKPIILF